MEPWLLHKSSMATKPYTLVINNSTQVVDTYHCTKDVDGMNVTMPVGRLPLSQQHW